MSAPPTLVVREWSTTEPAETGPGTVLRRLELTGPDRELLSALADTSLRVRELRQGLMIETGPEVGTVTLSRLRIVVMPKLRIDQLMRLVAYAFDLSDIAVAAAESSFDTDRAGFADLLALSLLDQVRRVARGGLLSRYVAMVEDLGTPRGRIDLLHAATHPDEASLRCCYDELTPDHRLNQVVAAGLRFAARVVAGPDLALELVRAADRFFGDIDKVRLDEHSLREAIRSLDRKSRHYRVALGLVALLFHGARLGPHERVGEVRLSSFLLDMNLLFERALTRYLREHAPTDIDVTAQEVCADAFTYLENPAHWHRPAIRPDLVFRRRGEVVAIGDAKYKDRVEHPPSAPELYQLTTYGLSFEMAEPRDVMLFHPEIGGAEARPARLLFSPPAMERGQVRIRLVGVPLDAIGSGHSSWWPLP